MRKKEREICEFEMDLNIFLVCALSNDNIISAYRPGLKTDMDKEVLSENGCGKLHFLGLKLG